MLTDARTYRWAGRTLQLGMYLSFGCMVAGLVWWLVAGTPGGSEQAREGIALGSLLAELSSGNPLALLNLGVVLLLFTPSVTLLSLVITFAMARNWRFVGIGALVGATLATGMALALR